MADPLPYSPARVTPTPEQLASWQVEWQELHASGPCPRCDDDMPFDWQLDYAQMRAEVAPLSVTREVICACPETHPDTPQGTAGCGASWVARFYEDEKGGHAEPQEDSRLVAAARALDAAGRDAETRLRTAAERWVAGVAAVLALFGIAGTVTGGTLLDELSDEERQPVVALTLAAVAVAVVAIVFSYLAAYGWPKVVQMTDPNLLKWYEERRKRLETIAHRLRYAVVASVMSIGLLTLAGALTWLNASTSPTTTLKVTDKDDSVTCGTLLAAKTAGTVRLRVADGSVKEVPLGTASNIESVSSC